MTPSTSRTRAAELTQNAFLSHQAGQRDHALSYLAAATLADRSYVPAWFLLAELAETSADKRSCLEMVLEHDPQNQQARDLVDLLRLEAQAAARALPAPSYPPPGLPSPPPSIPGTAGPYTLPGQPSAVRSGCAWAFVPIMVVLSLVICCVTQLGLLPNRTPMYATEHPPADWHQLSGESGFKLWAPPSYDGGSPEQYNQAKLARGLVAEEESYKTVFAMDDFVGEPPNVSRHALVRVQAIPASGLLVGPLDRAIWWSFDREQDRVVSSEIVMLGLDRTVEARRMLVEWSNDGDISTHTSLAYSFEHAGKYWNVLFFISDFAPGWIAQYDLIVRTISINE